MSDVAREANVNRITVSRALSNPELVAAKTLERVNAAITKTNYVPNQIARMLKSEHSQIVSLLTPPQMAGVYGKALDLFSNRLFNAGLVANLFPVLTESSQQDRVVAEVTGWKPAAIVLFGMQLSSQLLERLLGSEIPVLDLFDYREDSLFACVGYDQYDASRKLTSHLLSQGYKKILFVHSANPTISMGPTRLKGFTDSIAESGGELSMHAAGEDSFRKRLRPIMRQPGLAGIEIRSKPNYRAGFELVSDLAEADLMPDAILFGSDMVAVGAHQNCNSNGISIPGDVALCTFDGTELTTVVSPSLTSLDLPYERVVDSGADQIVKLAREQSADPVRIKVSIQVVHRQST